MLEHEELDDLDLVGRQSQPAADVAGDPRPEHAVVLDEALADVVQEQREQQRPLAAEGPPLRAQPVVGRRAGRHPLDGQQAVLVHGVLVKAVELQQVAGVGELRDQDLEHAHVVQPAERRGDLGRMGEQAEEGLVGRPVGLAGQRGHGGPHRLPGVSGDRHVVEHRQLRQPHDLPQAARHARDLARRRGDVGRPHAERGIDVVAEQPLGDRRQRPTAAERPQERVHHLRDAAGVPEVFPHEPLDTEQAVAGLQTAGRGNPHLLVTGQLVGGLARGEMEVVPHPEEKLSGIADRVGIGPRDAPRMREVVEGFSAIRQPPQPADELDVAKPAR